MITALKALAVGLLLAARRARLVFLLFLVNLLFAIVLSVPFWSEIKSVFSHSQTGVTLVERYNREAITDWLNTHEPELDPARRSLRYGALAYLALGAVLLGGILSILADPKTRTSLLAFSAGCGRYVWTFLRADLVLVALLAALYGVNIWLSRAVRWVLNDWLAYASSSTTIGWIMFTKSLLVLFLFAVVLQGVSYAKIRAVVDGDRCMLRGTLRGLGLVGRHPLATNVFLLAVVVLLGATYSLYVYARGLLPARQLQIGNLGTIPPHIAYLLLVAAIMILVHALLVAKHAGQIHIYRTLTARPPERGALPGALGPPADYDRDSSPSQIGKFTS
ncbi:MAG: hypothetical protein AB1486_21230 [Planctomycetota bacterium]